jgi:hypothetical protein
MRHAAEDTQPRDTLAVTAARDGSRMKSSARIDITFELATQMPASAVHLRLRAFGERWVASADINGAQRVGVGSSARAAVVASLTTLDPRARAVLLADPALLDVSSTIAADATERRRASEG